jgi:hypothetical protein
VHDINPALQPPDSVLVEAQGRALQMGKPVYLFQNQNGWDWVEKIAHVPPGSLITEIVGNSGAPETWNTGGC